MIRFDPKQYSINDFIEWDQRKELTLTPKFQRRSVWSDKARSYFIDTIINGLPIPPVFMRHDVDPATRKSLREIVDGQQRIRTILNYAEDGFTINKTHNEEFGGKYFSQLPEETQKDFLQYQIPTDILQGIEDSEILDIFARLNTYTLKLNKQELRNAEYFGVFKKTVYFLGYEYANFWVNNKVLTEKKVARMEEAEFASELIIIILAGLQDRKKIDEYYKKYDDKFEDKEKVIHCFRKTIDTISEILGDTLPTSCFSKKPLFYSLFGVIYELDKESILDKKDYPKVLSILQEIDSILNLDTADLSQEFFEFSDASTKHVTNLAGRKIRHEFIKNRILKEIGS